MIGREWRLSAKKIMSERWWMMICGCVCGLAGHIKIVKFTGWKIEIIKAWNSKNKKRRITGIGHIADCRGSLWGTAIVYMGFYKTSSKFVLNLKWLFKIALSNFIINISHSLTKFNTFTSALWILLSYFLSWRIWWFQIIWQAYPHMKMYKEQYGSLTVFAFEKVFI